MIEIKNLSKAFKYATVLSDVSVLFPDSSVTAVIGPNGSGKTTLMKCILGLVRPDTGSISINGVSALGSPDGRRKLGYMSQIARYPENLSPVDLFTMVERVRNTSSVRTQTLIDLFDLGPHLLKPMRTLSGGTRQKVGAIIALMFEPRVLLLDEPTAGLDPISTGVLKDLIIEARTGGATVLITSHILSEIQELAERAIFLHEGCVVFDGTVESLMQRTGDVSLERSIASMMRDAQRTAGAS